MKHILVVCLVLILTSVVHITSAETEITEFTYKSADNQDKLCYQEIVNNAIVDIVYDEQAGNTKEFIRGDPNADDVDACKKSCCDDEVCDTIIFDPKTETQCFLLNCSADCHYETGEEAITIVGLSEDQNSMPNLVKESNEASSSSSSTKRDESGSQSVSAAASGSTSAELTTSESEKRDGEESSEVSTSAEETTSAPTSRSTSGSKAASESASSSAEASSSVKSSTAEERAEEPASSSSSSSKSTSAGGATESQSEEERDDQTATTIEATTGSEGKTGSVSVSQPDQGSSVSAANDIRDDSNSTDVAANVSTRGEEIKVESGGVSVTKDGSESNSLATFALILGVFVLIVITVFTLRFFYDQYKRKDYDKLDYLSTALQHDD